MDSCHKFETMKERIRHLFDSQAILTDREWEIFGSKLEARAFSKGEIILMEGQVEQYLSFIVTGTIRQFVYSDKGEDISMCFCSDNSFFSSYASFITRQPSRTCTEALDDLEVLRISYDNLQECYSISHTGERLGRLNAELSLAFKEEREIMLLTMSAQERYIHLLENNPKLLSLVKLEHIATYLGITPQSLSRIRRAITV